MMITEGGSSEASFAGRQTRAARPKGEGQRPESIPPITTKQVNKVPVTLFPDGK
jgi:hypothetical protein